MLVGTIFLKRILFVQITSHDTSIHVNELITEVSTIIEKLEDELGKSAAETW